MFVLRRGANWNLNSNSLQFAELEKSWSSFELILNLKKIDWTQPKSDENYLNSA